MEDKEKYTRLLYGSKESYDLKCRDGCDVDMDCVDCPSFENVIQRLGEYESTKLSPEEINDTLHRFSSFLLEMTGNRMSKTNYTLDVMIALARDTQEEACDECEYKNGWISVKKRVPALVCNRVLCVTDELCSVFLGHYEGGDGWYNLETGEPFEGAVTHWMPLPAPPDD